MTYNYVYTTHSNITVIEVPLYQSLDSFLKISNKSSIFSVKERKIYKHMYNFDMDESTKNCDYIIYSGEGYTKSYRKKRYFVANGQGKAVFPNGKIFIGVWIDGFLHGITNVITPKSKFIGQYKLGLINGYGKLVIDENYAKKSADSHIGSIESIEGNWITDKINGNAVVKYRDGSKFIGGINHHYKQHGRGIYYKNDGTIINSTWSDGKIISKCKIKYTNCLYFGGLYFGECDDFFMPHGYGIMKSDGCVYRGYWYNGKKNGYGFYSLPNGDYYNGYWLDDKKHGIGIYFTKTGDHAIESFWDNDIKLYRIRSYHY